MQTDRFRSHPTGLTDTAFLSLYQERWEAELQFFVRSTLVPEVAADLTAEAFARAFIDRGRFDPTRGDPAGWLHGISRHVLGSYFRSARVEREARDKLGLPHQVLDASDTERVEEMIDFAEVGRGVQQALAELDAEQREAVVCRVVDGLAYEQIAERLGCSQEASRARVSRGLRALGEALAAQSQPPFGAPS